MTKILTRRHFMGIFAGLAVSSLSPAFAAKDGPAADYVQGIGKNVMQLANGGTRGKALRGKFASLLGRYVNLQNIAGTALGTYRSKLPAGDKGKFNQLVTTYAAALFVWYADEFKGSAFVVDSVTPQGNGFIVKSHIVQGAVSGEQLDWYLASTGGSFQVTDMKVKGVRLSLAMRDAFSRELKKSKGDFNGLYDFLREAETW